MAPEHTLTAEEEDLDDLDGLIIAFLLRGHTDNMHCTDIVDQFDPNPAKPETTRAPSVSSVQPTKEALGSASSSTQAANPKPDESSELPEDLAKQLAESMESFMRELAGTQAEPVKEEELKLRGEWEKMLIEGMNGISVDERSANSSSVPASGAPSGSTAGGDDEFQKSIRAAMEKLKSSDSALHVCTNVPLLFAETELHLLHYIYCDSQMHRPPQRQQIRLKAS